MEEKENNREISSYGLLLERVGRDGVKELSNPELDSFSQSYSNRFMNWAIRKDLLEEISSVLPSAGESRILDAGCCNGSLLFLLERMYSKSGRNEKQIYCGMDLSPRWIRFAAARAFCLGKKNMFFKIASCYALPYSDGSFDCIICTEVIEHLEFPDRALSEFRRVLKNSGTLILTTPNARNMVWHFRRAMEKFRVSRRKRKSAWNFSGQREAGVGHEHISEFSFSELEKIISGSGFEIVNHYGTGGLLFGSPLLDTKPLTVAANIFFSTLLRKKKFFSYFFETQLIVCRKTHY